MIVKRTAMSKLTITSQPIPRKGAVVKIVGAQSDDDFDQLSGELATILDAGVIAVALDVSELTSVTSAGLGAIIELGKILQQREGKLVIAIPSKEFADLVDILGIAPMLNITDSLGEAKKAVSVF